MEKQKVTFENRQKKIDTLNGKKTKKYRFTELFDVRPKGLDQAEIYRTRALALNWNILKVEIVNI